MTKCKITYWSHTGSYYGRSSAISGIIDVPLECTNTDEHLCVIKMAAHFGQSITMDIVECQCVLCQGIVGKCNSCGDYTEGPRFYHFADMPELQNFLTDAQPKRAYCDGLCLPCYMQSSEYILDKEKQAKEKARLERLSSTSWDDIKPVLEESRSFKEAAKRLGFTTGSTLSTYLKRKGLLVEARRIIDSNKSASPYC